MAGMASVPALIEAVQNSLLVFHDEVGRLLSEAASSGAVVDAAALLLAHQTAETARIEGRRVRQRVTGTSDVPAATVRAQPLGNRNFPLAFGAGFSAATGVFDGAPGGSVFGGGNALGAFGGGASLAAPVQSFGPPPALPQQQLGHGGAAGPLGSSGQLLLFRSLPTSRPTPLGFAPAVTVQPGGDGAAIQGDGGGGSVWHSPPAVTPYLPIGRCRCQAQGLHACCRANGKVGEYLLEQLRLARSNDDVSGVKFHLLHRNPVRDP